MAAYECWIVDRSLREKLVPVPWSSFEFERVEDDISAASATVAEDAQATLRGARPWRHGLGIWRDRKMEWIGPITSLKRSRDSTDLTVGAQDILAWTMKRFVRETIEHELIDLGLLFDILIVEATKRDNAFGLRSDTPPVGVAGKRSYLASTDSQIFSAIQELARTGMDFTVWRKQVISGPTNGLFPGFLVVNQSGFAGRVGVELDGNAQSNSQRTAAGGTGGSEGFTIVGEYEDWDPAGDGLLESFETEAQIEDVESAEAASRGRWDDFHSTPRVVSVPPLSDQFPGTFDDLIPGKRWRLQIDDPIFEISGDYRLTKVAVRVEKDRDGTITETIQPELQGAT